MTNATPFYSISMSRDRLMKQSSGSRIMTIFGGVGALVCVIGAIAWNGMFWVPAVVFILIAAVGGFRWYLGRTAAAATDDQLIVAQVGEAGIYVPDSSGAMFPIPWDEIASVRYRWQAAGGGTAYGIAGAVTKVAVDSAMAKRELDNAKRDLQIVFIDWPATKVKYTAQQRRWFIGPMLGDPGMVIRRLGGSLRDEQFTELLQVLGAELQKRGKPLEQLAVG